MLSEFSSDAQYFLEDSGPSLLYEYGRQYRMNWVRLLGVRMLLWN